MPVSLPSVSTTARTLRLCRSVRCAMLSASCSMEMPAVTCRTLDWLSTRLLNGISREGDKVIFWTAFVMSILHDGRPRASLDLQLVAENDPPSHSRACGDRAEPHAAS